MSDQEPPGIEPPHESENAELPKGLFAQADEIMRGVRNVIEKTGFPDKTDMDELHHDLEKLAGESFTPPRKEPTYRANFNGLEITRGDWGDSDPGQILANDTGIKDMVEISTDWIALSQNLSPELNAVDYPYLLGFSGHTDAETLSAAKAYLSEFPAIKNGAGVFATMYGINSRGGFIKFSQVSDNMPLTSNRPIIAHGLYLGKIFEAPVQPRDYMLAQFALNVLKNRLSGEK